MALLKVIKMEGLVRDNHLILYQRYMIGSFAGIDIAIETDIDQAILSDFRGKTGMP
jgi:hypothetical protein